MRILLGISYESRKWKVEKASVETTKFTKMLQIPQPCKTYKIC